MNMKYEAPNFSPSRPLFVLFVQASFVRQRLALRQATICVICPSDFLCGISSNLARPLFLLLPSSAKAPAGWLESYFHLIQMSGR